jgi:hypothetical protein
VANLGEYRFAAFAALDRFWFIQSIEEVERTDITLSLRLHIRTTLFVHVFVGENTGSISFALVERDARIFGLDRHRGKWHLHPYRQIDQHIVIDEPLLPTPLFRFLMLVEQLLLEEALL